MSLVCWIRLAMSVALCRGKHFSFLDWGCFQNECHVSISHIFTRICSQNVFSVSNLKVRSGVWKIVKKGLLSQHLVRKWAKITYFYECKEQPSSEILKGSTWASWFGEIHVCSILLPYSRRKSQNLCLGNFIVFSRRLKARLPDHYIFPRLSPNFVDFPHL